MDSRAHHVASLSPGSKLQFEQGRLAAHAKELELLVPVTEESKGEIDPRCSCDPIIGKLYCASRRCKTLQVSPGNSLKCSINRLPEKNTV